MRNRTDAEPAIDRERLRAVSLDDAEFEAELIGLFLADSGVQLERLRSALAANDPGAAAAAAHRLKGAASNIGAGPLTAYCGEIERAALGGAPEHLSADAVASAYEAACRNLRARLRELAGAESAEPGGTLP